MVKRTMVCGEWQVARSVDCTCRTGVRRRAALSSILNFLLLSSGGIAYGQQPHYADPAIVQGKHAETAGGVAPGYWPTAGTGLTLNLAAGTAVCSNTVYTYAGGTLTMAASATNYVFLNVSSGCTPASNTTGFSTTTIPIAKVTASASAITSILDVRTPFTYGMSGGGGSGSPGGTNGQVQFNNNGTFGGETLPGLGNGTTVFDASLESGADWSYKVNAAIAACPAYACVVDGRGFASPQTMSESIDLKTSGGGPVTLLLPAQINRSSGAVFELENYARVIGLGRASGNTGNGSSTFIYNGSGDTATVFANNTGGTLNWTYISDLSVSNSGSFTIKDLSGTNHNVNYNTGVCIDFSNALHNTVSRTNLACQIGLKLSDASYDGAYYNSFYDNLFNGLNPDGVQVLMGQYPNENNFYGNDIEGWGTAVFMQGIGGFVNFSGGDIEGAGAGFVINSGTNIGIHDFYFEELGARTTSPIYAVWQANWAEVQGGVVGDSSGYTHVCITAGTTGASAPSWNETYGGTTSDNGVVWLTVNGAQVVFGPNAVGNLVDGALGPSIIDDYSTTTGGTSNYRIIPPNVNGSPGLAPLNFAANTFTIGNSLNSSVGFSGQNYFSIGLDAGADGNGPQVKYAGNQRVVEGLAGEAPIQAGGVISNGGILGSMFMGTLNVVGLPNPAAPTVALYGSHAGSSTVSYALTADTCGGSASVLEGGYTLPGSFTQITNAPSTPGALISVAVNALGSGYQVNDVLTLVNALASSEGGSSNGQVTVTGVNGSGGITSVSLTTAGNGYADGLQGQGATGGHGSGATFNLTAYDLVEIYPATFSQYGTSSNYWSGCKWDLIKDPTGGTSTAQSLEVAQAPNMGSIYVYGPTSGVLLDYGQSLSSYTEPSTRNTTADVNFNSYVNFRQNPQGGNNNYNFEATPQFYFSGTGNGAGTGGNAFFDGPAAYAIIHNYNTPRTSGQQCHDQWYSSSSEHTVIFEVCSAGSSSGADAIKTKNNTLDDGSGNLTTAGYVNTASGFQYNGAATSGHYLRGNGSDYVDSAIQGGDLPAPTASVLGGVESLVCSSGQFLSGINTSGAPQCGTPSGGGNVSTSGTITTGSLAEWASGTTLETGNLGGDCSTSGSLAMTCTQMQGGKITANSSGIFNTYDNLSTLGTGVPFIPAVSNVTSQSSSQSAVTLAGSPAAGMYRLNLYADANSGSGSTYFVFNWTDGSGSARSLTTGLLTLSGGYISGLFPIYVGSGNVTYSSTVNGTVNYDVHITLERMQ